MNNMDKLLQPGLLAMVNLNEEEQTKQVGRFHNHKVRLRRNDNEYLPPDAWKMYTDNPEMQHMWFHEQELIPIKK